MRELGVLAGPPRLSALRQPRRLFPEVFTHTKVGRAEKEKKGATLQTSLIVSPSGSAKISGSL
jgi:hypothetical protein